MIRKIEDYIPVELFHEAKTFVREMDDDVEIYKKIRTLKALKPCEEADKFVAYWYLEGDERFPHALITLYENKHDIDLSLDDSNITNGIEILQQRFKKYYLLLKQEGMIDE